MKAHNIYHYCHVMVESSQSIATRTLSYTDLTFVLSGRLRYTVNGETRDLLAGDALLAPPGSVESRTALDEPAEYVSFNFSAEPLDFPIFAEGMITPTVEALVGLYPAAHMYEREEATAEKCLCLLNYILLEMADSNRRKGSFYPRVALYVNNNVTRPISLLDVSRELGVTKEYLSIVFKRESGMTVNEFINRRKMSLAKNLIIEGETPLCRVSEQLGYNDYTYFCRVFKKTFGVSPTKMRYSD